MDHMESSIASQRHEAYPPVLQNIEDIVGQSTRPGLEHTGKFGRRIVAPLLLVIGVAACSVREYVSGDKSSDGTTPTETTDTTIAIETVPTTEPVIVIVSTTEETTAPTLAPTTTEAVTEITANINAAARCELESDPRTVLPGTILDQAGVPDLDKLKFYGNCTGLPGDYDWFWGYPGGPGYDINLDTTGLDYGEHYTELRIGSTDITNVNWDAEHPEYRQYGALTLRELAALEPGTPVCWYLGTTAKYAQNLIFGRVGLVTNYDQYNTPVPKTRIAIFFLKPDGSEDPEVGWADGMGVAQDAETGAWDYTFIRLGEKCEDLQVAA